MNSTTEETATAMEATVTSKGQVTLPKELRRRLRIQ
jgi:bifunctional DNA-binding transcriptional regulator/antitoxin component of YhaV-PrlF toxin-antitoxin module